jgi:phosphonate transport system permease protein
MTQEIVNLSALERVQARALAGKPGLSYYLGWFFVFLIMAWAWNGAEIRPLDLVRDSGNIVTLAEDFFPPNFLDWRIYVKEMVVTIHIALWGTLLAALVSVPLGFLCASNVVRPWVYQPLRRLMDALRAVNEMVFALLFIVAVGLGPFAGVLALFVHTTGTLSKLFSEAVEAIDPRPVEGIRAAGGSKLAEVAFGILPQVLPMWISFCLYRFESNVRSASVVGMVGAGGIGVILYEVIRGFEYAETCAVLIILVVTVTLIDIASAFLRSRVT